MSLEGLLVQDFRQDCRQDAKHTGGQSRRQIGRQHRRSTLETRLDKNWETGLDRRLETRLRARWETKLEPARRCLYCWNVCLFAQTNNCTSYGPSAALHAYNSSHHHWSSFFGALLSYALNNQCLVCVMFPVTVHWLPWWDRKCYLFTDGLNCLSPKRIHDLKRLQDAHSDWAVHEHKSAQTEVSCLQPLLQPFLRIICHCHMLGQPLVAH